MKKKAVLSFAVLFSMISICCSAGGTNLKVPVGRWETIDFVDDPTEFKPGDTQFGGELFLKGFAFEENGSTTMGLQKDPAFCTLVWREGKIIDEKRNLHYPFFIENLGGQEVLFLPWLSGDISEDGLDPGYYVLKREGTPPLTPGPGLAKVEDPNRAPGKFDDVRNRDLGKFDFRDKLELLETLDFNQKTVWPASAALPAGWSPERTIEDWKNPGLGVRKLHQEGFTGKGVKVAIIDQAMHLDHPEFAGKIASYLNLDLNETSSMHGPAVTSILVGNTCGVAPEAVLYYAAFPSGDRDATPLGKALEWIIAINAGLPAGQGIRVVSVSTSPSGTGSPFKTGGDQWDKAVEKARKAGILVIDTSDKFGFISPCFFDRSDPESPSKCTPGFPGRISSRVDAENVCAPCSPRTTAEQYHEKTFSFQHNGRGGLSWGIPYAAGVLALGWQIRPDLTPDEIKDVLFESAEKSKGGAKIIDPVEFIRLIKALPKK